MDDRMIEHRFDRLERQLNRMMLAVNLTMMIDHAYDGSRWMEERLEETRQLIQAIPSHREPSSQSTSSTDSTAESASFAWPPMPGATAPTRRGGSSKNGL